VQNFSEHVQQIAVTFQRDFCNELHLLSLLLLLLPQVQDTIVVCAPQMSQQLALAALQEGDDYVQQGIAGLSHNRELIADALSPLGTKGHGWVGGEGAIYYWARLPEQFRGADAAAGDEAVVEWLIKEHGVCIIPGSACGVLGHVRVAFANLRAEQCEVAAARLKRGLQQLVSLNTLACV
jgi:katanin p60 ATPase-containing subunit A1